MTETIALKPITEEFLRAAPKSDLHVHLDGSLRLSTLIELAQERGIELPSTTEEGLLELVFRERYPSLSDYLKGFALTTAVMQDEESLERIAYEFIQDNFQEGVRYVEPRFAPQLHVNRDLKIADVLLAVNRGLRRATEEINASPAIRGGAEPKMAYGLIMCAMRMFGPDFSDYYRQIFEVHAYTPRKEVLRMASVELARAAVEARDRYGVPIAGFDLAGQENGYPARDHKAAYEFAHANFLKKTVHAGEAYGPESIFQAISELHADRIGHGYHLFSPWMIEDPDIADRQSYVRNLAEYIADRRITLEVCLTSNLQTMPQLRSVADHAFRDMWAKRLSIAICTDNRLVSRTTVTRELQLAIEHFKLTSKDVRHLVTYGFKRSFFPGSYIEKRAYVRQMIDYYEAMERKYLGGSSSRDDVPTPTS